jgi:hypothetical protein
MSDVQREVYVLERDTEAFGWFPAPGWGCSTSERDVDPRSGERVVRYVPCDETGEAFKLIVDAGCQGGVRTEGGSWIAELTNEHGDRSTGYGPIAPKGENQPGARKAVLMAIENFPRGVR